MRCIGGTGYEGVSKGVGAPSVAVSVCPGTRGPSSTGNDERRHTMRALCVLMSLLLFGVPALAATGDGSSSSDPQSEWTLTLTLVGIVGVGLALLAIFTPDDTGDEVIVSDPETDGGDVDSEALEAVEASRAAEAEEEPEPEATGEDLFRDIEGD